MFILSNKKLVVNKMGNATRIAIKKLLSRKRNKLKNEFPTT